jgi:CheY-like chemotaxis protein
MPKRILICDDEVHILLVAEFKFRRAGYEVQTAGDGQEAWELIQQRVPDLLITDCQMPRLNGFGLTQRLRAVPATADLPILMLTAKGFEIDSRELAAQWKVLGLISKPFSPREMLETVNRILGGPGPANGGQAQELYSSRSA